jgi:hypothetical protein
MGVWVVMVANTARLLAVRPVAVNNDNKQQQAKRGRKIKD